MRQKEELMKIGSVRVSKQERHETFWTFEQLAVSLAMRVLIRRAELHLQGTEPA